MYRQHFGLNCLPFHLTPDTDFFCDLATHREALNVLLLALQGGEGFVKISGPVGTGKTLLCRKLLNELPADFITAYIPNPDMDTPMLQQTIAEELGIKYNRNSDQHGRLKQLNHFLLRAAGAGKKVVVCIDEAQAMPVKTLESLRLLSNLETEKQKLLHIVLFGQPELDELLNSQCLRQLRQRIGFSYTLQALDAEQIKHYVLHRLQIAGSTHTRILGPFTPYCLHFYSKGIPRLVNILAHKALLAAYGTGSKQLHWRHIYQAAQDSDDCTALPGLRLTAVQLLGLICCISVLFFFSQRIFA
jgi:MSHA biogenesis protein MshM